MRARKSFVVIAYDIANDKRRNRIVKELSRYGKRVNLSVYECMLTDAQYKRLMEKLEDMTDPKEDNLIFYPICLNCFAGIKYIPAKRKVANYSASVI